MTKFCQQCGAEIDETMQFCSKCGSNVSDTNNVDNSQIKNNDFILQKQREDETLQQKFFSYSGRLNRKPYFIRQFAINLMAIIIYAILVSLDENTGELLGGIVSSIAGISCLLLGIRRLHDLDKSGWYILIMCIPIINIVFGLYLLFAKGTEGDNKYGNDPLSI